MQHIKSIHLIITGHVQGVWYRASAKTKADDLGIVGYAKNRTDGSVEILAQGEEAALQQFEAWCWEGSSGADVENVEKEKAKMQTFDGFAVR